MKQQQPRSQLRAVMFVGCRSCAVGLSARVYFKFIFRRPVYRFSVVPGPNYHFSPNHHPTSRPMAIVSVLSSLSLVFPHSRECAAARSNPTHAPCAFLFVSTSLRLPLWFRDTARLDDVYAGEIIEIAVSNNFVVCYTTCHARTISPSYFSLDYWEDVPAIDMFIPYHLRLASVQYCLHVNFTLLFVYRKS